MRCIETEISISLLYIESIYYTRHRNITHQLCGALRTLRNAAMLRRMDFVVAAMRRQFRLQRIDGANAQVRRKSRFGMRQEPMVGGAQTGAARRVHIFVGGEKRLGWIFGGQRNGALDLSDNLIFRHHFRTQRWIRVRFQRMRMGRRVRHLIR